MQGKIVIGTEIDTKGLEQGIKDIEKHSAEINVTTNEDEELFKLIENEYDDTKKEIESKPVEIKIEGKSFEKQINNIKEQMQQMRESIEQKRTEISNTQNGLLIELNTQEIKELESEYEKLNNQLIDLTEKQEKYNQKVANLNTIGQPQVSFINPSDTQESLKALNYIKEMKQEIDKISSQKVVTDDDLTRAEDLKKKIEETRIEYEKMTGQKLHISGITDVSKESQKVDVSGLKNGFESLYKSAKRLAMGIIGVRAAYSLIRKAASSYLADNQKTAGNIANLWTGLGTLMSGIIEGIVSLLRKAVTAILYFASVLTGVNYIAKANAAILKKQKKATAGLRKEQEKLTASFDEMNILQDNSSNSADGMGANAQGDLFDVKELGNAKEIIEKIAIALKPVWEIIKGIVKFALEHPGVILGLLAGAKVIGMIAKIMGVGGIAGTGLLGLFGVLTAIASIGAIVISVTSLIKGFKETKEYNEEVEELTKNQAKLSEEIQEKVRAADLDKKQIKELVKNYAGLNIVKSEEISNTKRQRSEYNGFQRATASLSGELSRQNATIQGNVKTMYEQIKTMKEWYDQGLLNKEETNEYRILLEDFRVAVGESTEEQKRFVDEFTRTSEEASELNGYINEVNTAYKNYKTNAKNAADQSEKTAEKIDEVGDAMSDLKKNNDVKLKITADTKEAFNKMKALFDFGPLKSVFKVVGKNLGMAKGGIYMPPKLAVGGIINRPGRGVTLGSAIGGERGAEGV